MKIVSWNMQNKKESWRFLVTQHQDYDFAFVGEACVPPGSARRSANAAGWNVPYETWDLQPGETRRKYRQEILGIRDGWTIARLDRNQVVDAAQPAVSDRVDRIFRRWHRAAVATKDESELCLVCVVSGHSQAQSLPSIVSGVRSVLEMQGHNGAMPMIVAGDLTTNETKSKAMFAEMHRIGLTWAGPCGANYIHVSGRKADQRETPATAHRHLNHVFVSEQLADRVTVSALNDPDEKHPNWWGPSDHCRILIEVAE